MAESHSCAALVGAVLLGKQISHGRNPARPARRHAHQTGAIAGERIYAATRRVTYVGSPHWLSP